MIFEPFGEQGQQCLGRSRVLICGCGALGGSVAAILARAGVGFLRLLDDDIVTFGNLHRQFLFDESDAKSEKLKVIAATQALHGANAGVTVEPVVVRLTAENGADFVADVDLLVDGTDNFPSRFLLNELALRFGKPLVSGGVCGMSGQVVTVIPGRTPCLACVLDPSLAEAACSADGEIFPVLSPIVQVVSAYQATDAIKILSGHSDRVSGEMVTFDLWDNRVRRFPLNQSARDRCPLCKSSAR